MIPHPVMRLAMSPLILAPLVLALLAPLTMAAAVSLVGAPAAAQGVPSPFGEPESSRPSKRPTPAAAPAASPLEAMDGVYPAPIGTSPPPGSAPSAPEGTATTGTVEREALPPPPEAAVPALPPSEPGARPPNSRGELPQGPLPEAARTVMRDELAPVMAGDGSGLPHELWRGLTVADVEKLFAALEIPPRSPVLHQLFRRLVTSDVPPPSGGANDPRFTALRIEALDRSGLDDAAAAVLDQDAGRDSDPVLGVLAARTAIARGDREGGCRSGPASPAAQAALPGKIKGQAILIRAYCAALAGQREAAQLQAALAREDASVEATAGLDAIDAIAAGVKPTIAKGQAVGLVDWRILELAGPVDASGVIDSASPGLLAVISHDTGTDPTLRLAAAEGAARFNAISASDLAAAYRGFQGGGAMAADGEGAGAGAVKRAALFQAADSERTPLKKARLIRSFLDETRRNGLYWPALQMIAPAARDIQRIPEIGWFAETAIETAIASGDFAAARSWADFADGLDGPGGARNGGFQHWLALADLADPALTEGRSRHLSAVEDLAQRGRMTSDLLHRLATVLDALDVQVPIPLWDLASRTAQPTTGHLPATGVLSELSDAAKKKEFGRTVLLAMQALGPNGAEGAHMISLGDSIRALRRAGLEPDARQLALEALFAGWPRALGS